MAADYYYADTENGDHIDDPSEDALFMLISDLNDTDNTFVAVEPADDSSSWYASVSLLEDGTHEVEYRDVDRREHQLTTEIDRSTIALDLTVWIAARNFPGLPSRRSDPDFRWLAEN